MSHASRQRGFTLIELLVVISLIAIMAGLAVPSFREFMASQRVRGGVSEYTGSLLLARSEAIKRNTTVSVTAASSGWAAGWTVAVSGSTTALVTQAALTDVEVTTVPSGLMQIDFTGTGRLSTSPKLQFSSATSVRCLTVGMDGYPSAKIGSC